MPVRWSGRPLGAKAQHQPVAVDVEVDRDPRASGGGEPVQQWACRRTEVVRAERGDAPSGDVRDVVLGPCVQRDQGNPVRGDRGRQQFLYVWIPVTCQRRHGHGVKAWVLAHGCANVGVRVDPHDGQVVAVPAGELEKWRDADRAFPAKNGDPSRVVAADHVRGARELPDVDRLGFYAVAFLQASSLKVTGAVAVGPSCAGRTASRTAEPRG